MFRRISLFYKKFYLWKLIIIPPVMMLFVTAIPLHDRLMFYFLSILQNFFTVYFFISLYDFLEIKSFERHINILLPILAITLIFLRSSNRPELYFLNPFGGVINLPIYNSGLLFFVVPALLFIALYLLNAFYIHKNWLKN